MRQGEEMRLAFTRPKLLSVLNQVDDTEIEIRVVHDVALEQKKKEGTKQQRRQQEGVHGMSAKRRRQGRSSEGELTSGRRKLDERKWLAIRNSSRTRSS